MKILGIALLLALLMIAALQIGGIAFALMEKKAIAGVYPWTLPLTEPAYSKDNYIKAWGVVAAIPIFTGAFLAALIFMPRQSNNFGSARFACAGDLGRQKMLSKSGIILGKTGRSERAPLIRQDQQTHTLLAAPTGSGKNVSIIFPNLLTYGGSVICADVKGENWNLAARARQNMGDTVYRFSPRALDGCSHRWNPLSYISTEPARRISELRQLAAYLLPITSASSDSWIRGARNIFTGVCLYVLDHGEQKTLGAVYRAIFGPYGFRNSLKTMLETPNLDPECQRLLAQYRAFAEDQLSGYIGSLEPLNLWGDTLVDAATSGDDFDLRRLRFDPMSIYLAVNSSEAEELAPLLRMFFQQVIDILQSSEPGPDELYPVLMVMDEFRTLGKLEKVLSAITTIRGYGGRFLIVVQGLSNIVEIYGREGKDTIVQNCGFQIFHAMSDETSSEYLRKRLGRKTIKQMSKSYGAGRTPSRNYSETGKDLMSLDEIGRLDAKRNIIIVEGGWPVKGWQISYFEEKRFASLVATPPTPPLLKTIATLRPAATSSTSRAKSQQTPPGKSGAMRNGDGRFAIAQSRLNAMTEESRAQNVSWRALLNSGTVGSDVTETSISDAARNRTLNSKTDRLIESSDDSNDADVRFKPAVNTNLFERLKSVAEENGYSDVAEGIGIGASIMDGFSEAGIGRGRRAG